MKTKEEIETICSNIIDSESVNEKFKQAVYEGAILGYNQCQEDIKPLLKDLFSLWETLGKCGEISVGIDFTKHYERLKQQLNKQD